MIVLKGLVAAVALAHAATAFHPWYPDYRCAEMNTCPSSKKRAMEERDVANLVGTSLKIVQRLPKVSCQQSNQDTINKYPERTTP